jgi:hypothetical protein
MEDIPLYLSMEELGIYFLKIKAEESTCLKRLTVSYTLAV